MRGQETPVLGKVVGDERTIPLLNVNVRPLTRYGDANAIDFGLFSKTVISEEKLFTAEFAKRTYDAIWKSSTLPSDRQNLSNSPGLCLWLKGQIESLDIKNLDGITAFLNTVNVAVNSLQKGGCRDHQQFVSILHAIQKEMRDFIRVRLPTFALPLSTVTETAPEIGGVVTTTELKEAREQRAYLKTKLPVDNSLLFSAAFAKNIYQQMIEVSQRYNQVVLVEPEVCAAIKAKIESARTKDSVVDLLLFLNDTINEKGRWQLKDTSFILMLTLIRKQIAEHLSIAHPSICEAIQKDAQKENEERNEAMSACASYACWSGLCGLNALVQMPLNVLWPVVNIGLLCMPAMLGSICFPELICVRTSGPDNDGYKSDCCPFERDAFSDHPKYNYDSGMSAACVPIATTRKNCVGMWSKGEAALAHHEKLVPSRVLSETFVMR